MEKVGMERKKIIKNSKYIFLIKIGATIHQIAE